MNRTHNYVGVKTLALSNKIIMIKNLLTVKSLMLGFSIFTIAFLMGCGKDDDTAPLATAAWDFSATTGVIGQAPLNVQFSNNSEGAESYLWDFGDETTSTDEAPLHVYTSGGDYTVTLTAFNAEEVATVDQGTITLASPLAGTWVLDSLAAPTIDSIATAGRFTGAFEFGTSQADATCPVIQTGYSAVTGWTPSTGWTGVFSDAPGSDAPGYSSFWSELIFSGNYIGRTDFFENQFIFSNNGGYEVDLGGELRFPNFYVSTEADYSESDDWSNLAGSAGDLNAFKSSDAYSFTVTESTTFPGHGELTLIGEGAFLGSYFSGILATTAGTPATGKVPQSQYKYLISSVSADQLIVGGFTDSTCKSDWAVLKFKKVN